MLLGMVTAACYPVDQAEQKIAALASSAARHGWSLHRYGQGQAYQGNMATKIGMLLTWLRQQQGRLTHVLFVDGSDCVVQLGAQAAWDAYQSYGCPDILMGSETNLWPPDAVPRNKYPAAPTNMRYLNAGVFLARTDRLLVALQQLRNRYAAHRYPDRCDQRMWHQQFIAGFPGLALDYYSRLCYNTYGQDPAVALDWSKSQLRVRATDAVPVVLHNNGQFMPGPAGNCLAALHAHTMQPAVQPLP